MIIIPHHLDLPILSAPTIVHNAPLCLPLPLSRVINIIPAAEEKYNLIDRWGVKRQSLKGKTKNKPKRQLDNVCSTHPFI